MAKRFITKREMAKAEKIINRLDEKVARTLEIEFKCAVREEQGLDRLFGMTWLLKEMGIINFEEEDLLSRYYIERKNGAA